jgi:outer membrane protein assembly factor BamB
LSEDAASGLVVRLPEVEGVGPGGADANEPIKLAGTLARFDGVAAADLPGSWPRFRGGDFDGISKEKVGLARSWAAGGPGVLWSVDLGEGYAGAAVLGGRVYVLDYDQEQKADVLRCLSLGDGKDIWRYSYPVKIKRYHGMSRTVPVVTDKYVVTMGPKCHVTCLDSQTGEFKWMLNLVREYGSAVPEWYTGQCPLIEQGKAVIAPGGTALMMAVDCESGQVVWETPNPKGWAMTHSSIVPIDFAGKRMYVYCGGDMIAGGVVGVSAEDGSVLWEFEDWKMRTNVPSPVIVPEGLIFLSAGYNAGSLMLRLVEQGGIISAEVVFRLGPKVFGAEQQTPIFYEGHIYGVRPDRQLACLDLNGQIVWTSGSGHKFGLGPYTIGDGLIYVMNSSGLLSLAEATPTGYVQLGQSKVLEGPESWGPMAIVSGRLILRDLKRMICVDVAGQ